jgi:hypothetical protein
MPATSGCQQVPRNIFRWTLLLAAELGNISTRLCFATAVAAPNSMVFSPFTGGIKIVMIWQKNLEQSFPWKFPKHNQFCIVNTFRSFFYDEDETYTSNFQTADSAKKIMCLVVSLACLP